MTKNVGILLSAMSGEDKNDPATKNNPKNKKYLDNLKTGTLKGLRFGVNKTLGDSIYKQSVNIIIAGWHSRRI
jgi:amidase